MGSLKRKDLKRLAPKLSVAAAAAAAAADVATPVEAVDDVPLLPERRFARRWLLYCELDAGVEDETADVVEADAALGPLVPLPLRKGKSEEKEVPSCCKAAKAEMASDDSETDLNRFDALVAAAATAECIPSEDERYRLAADTSVDSFT